MSKKLNNGLKSWGVWNNGLFYADIKNNAYEDQQNENFLFTQMTEIIKIMMYPGHSTWGMITYMKKYTFVSE